jgi:hypothetical protein
VPRTEAEIEYERTRRLGEYIFGPAPAEVVSLSHKAKRKAAREKFEGALQANSAFPNLLQRRATKEDYKNLLGNENFYAVLTGAREFTREHARWLESGGRGTTMTIDDLTFGEDMFVRSEVSTDETLRVGGIDLKPFLWGVQTLQTTTTRVGLYQINHDMYEWADDLTRRLVNTGEEVKRPIPRNLLEYEFWKDAEWVNDDTGLIGQALVEHKFREGSRTVVYLISRDRRLANQMAQQANVTVILVDPNHVITGLPGREWSSTTRLTVNEVDDLFTPFATLDKPLSVYIDTGALASAASKWVETSPDLRYIYRKEPIETGTNSNGKRFETFRLHKVATRKIKAHDRGDIYYPVRRPRVKRGMQGGPESSHSSRSSWRRSDVTHQTTQGSV